MGYKYSITLFHVLRDVDLNKTINRPDNGVLVSNGERSAEFILFFEAFPKNVTFFK